MSQNTQISANENLKAIIATIGRREDQIRPLVAASGVGFDEFRSQIVQLLRTNPDVLQCTASSVVNACIDAAFDGLRLDGRQAAIQPRNVKVSKNPERWEKHAVYVPMVFGIVQQILAQSNNVLALDVEVVHERDHFVYERGLNPVLEHQPLVCGDRGRIIAAYAIATMAGGVKIPEVLLEADIKQIRATAETDYVWKKWEGEMAKKSAIRRIRKRLPLKQGVIISDREADNLYASMGATSQQAIDMPDRPTRQSIADQSGQAAGFNLDLDESEPVIIDQQERRREDRTAEKKAHVDKQEPAGQAADLPDGENEWSAWVKDVEKRVNAATDAKTVQAINEDERTRIAAADAERQDWVKGLISDRLADIAAGD